MIVAIMQARMGSTRLPKKTVADICGKPLLLHVIERVKRAKLVEKIVVATTDKKEDDVIEKTAKQCSIDVFRGSSDDVLDRFYQVAKKFSADIIVRITADDPFKDPEIIDKAVEIFLSKKIDYLNNFSEPTYPEGLDVEVFSFTALENAWRNAKKPFEREHATPYIWENPKVFKIFCMKNKRDLSKLRWTIDYDEDLKFARKVYEELYTPGGIFLMNDILNLLKRKPEIAKINADIKQGTRIKNLKR